MLKLGVWSTSLLNHGYQLYNLWQSPSQGRRAPVLCNAALPHIFSLQSEMLLNRPISVVTQKAALLCVFLFRVTTLLSSGGGGG